MNDFHKDILIGALLLMGMVGYMSNGFVLSSLAYAVAYIASNIKLDGAQSNAKEALCD
jgi:hypothetical protein